MVIVRFGPRYLRNEILQKENKEILKRFGVGVTEQLTPANLDLLKKAKAVVGVANVWSINGKLFARTAEGKVRITLDTELEKLTPPTPREDPASNNSGAPVFAKQSRRYRGNRQKFQQNGPPPQAWSSVAEAQTAPPTYYFGSQPQFMSNNTLPPNPSNMSDAGRGRGNNRNHKGRGRGYQ